MIVVSPNVVLSPVDGYTADNPVILWRNIVTLGNLTADEEDASYPARNLVTPSTIEKWKAETTAEQYLSVVTGEVDEIDGIGVARHNFGSASIPVSVEGRTTDDGEFEELAPEVIPPDDKPLLFRFAPQSLYEVRLRMQEGDAPPSAAVLYAGKLLIVQRRIYVGHAPIKFGRERTFATGMSESGEFLGRIALGESVETSVDLQNLTPAWYRAEMDPFIEASAEQPFFFAWRPGSYPYETGYAWMTNNPKPVNQRNNGMMSIGLQMAGIA